MPPITPSIPDGYRLDAKQRLVPIAHIKEIDLLRDTVVTDIVAKALTINAALAEFRERTSAEVQAFVQLSAEKYGAKIGGGKGNLTLFSFDGRYKLQRSMADVFTFDERLQAAKKLIDECIKDWSAGAQSELMTIVNDAFKVDKEGNIDTARVLSLRRHKIEDPRWKMAMSAISDSLTVAATRTYFRIYERVGETERYEPINLDLANA